MRSPSSVSVIPAASTCYPRRCGGARSHSCCCRGFAVGRAAPRVMALANCSAAWRAAASRCFSVSRRLGEDPWRCCCSCLRRQRSQKPVNGIRANSSMCLWLDGRFAPIRAAWRRAFASQRRAPACDPSGPPLRGAIMRLARTMPMAFARAKSWLLFRHQDMCVWPAATDCPGSGRLRRTPSASIGRRRDLLRFRRHRRNRFQRSRHSRTVSSGALPTTRGRRIVTSGSPRRLAGGAIGEDDTRSSARSPGNPFEDLSQDPFHVALRVER